MNFPRKIPKPAKRSSRFKSQAHLAHVRSHECSFCGASAPIEAAHVRLGSGAGMGQKPDDFRAVSLCRDCHAAQHSVGEGTFWEDRDPEALIDFFVRTSPRRAQIEQHIREHS